MIIREEMGSSIYNAHNPRCLHGADKTVDQVARFNLTHTVADIRRFILASRPDVRPPFRLATAFPAAELEDESITIEQAGLRNAVLVLKTG